MTSKNDLQEGCAHGAIAMVAVLLALVAILCSSCKTTVCGITNDDIAIDSVCDVTNIKDSVRWITKTRDSIYVEKQLITILDTAGNEKHTKEIIREFHYHDSNDSLAVMKQVLDSLRSKSAESHVQTIVKEKPLSLWQRICIDGFAFVLGFAVLFFCILIYIIKYKRQLGF